MNYGAASQTAKMSGFLVKVLRLDSRIERGNLEHAARPGLCSSLDPADVFLSDVFVFMFETNIDLKLCLVQTAVFASKTFGPRGLPESGILDGLAVLAGPVLGVEVNRDITAVLCRGRIGSSGGIWARDPVWQGRGSEM